MDNKIRCAWCEGDPLYTDYHDNEWGREVTSDKKMFEFIVLESAQAGLSWITILKKRKAYKKAFANFDFKKVAAFTEDDVERLMQNQGIVRNRLKIKAAISNAKAFIKVQKEFGSFCAYLKSFFPGGKPIINKIKSIKDIPAKNAVSDAISKDMKKRGFSFFGSVICYSHLQATGLINDHINTCWVKKQLN